MHKREKISAILVDGSNIYSTAKAVGYNIDYKKVLETFEGTVFKAYYFTALRAEDAQSPVRPMVDYLTYNGWTPITKQTQEWVQADGKLKIKGNMDIEIATVAFEIAAYVTDIVLFSGDGDFKFMVESLQRWKGINVTVVSTIKTNPAMCADSLRRQADNFIDVADMREMWQRDEEERASRAAIRERRRNFINGP